jgi:hypothetical protein
VHRDFPGEAHPTVHLHAGPGVGGRGLVGELFCAGHRTCCIANFRIVQHDRSAVQRGASELGADEHVGAEVLDRLERADRPVELLAALGVGDCQLRQPGSDPDLDRRGQQRAFLEDAGRVEVGRCSARCCAQLVQGGERVHRVDRSRTVSRCGGDGRSTNTDHEDRSCQSEVGNEQRGAIGFEHCDRPVGDSGSEEGADQRAGDAGPTELFEHQRRLDQAELEVGTKREDAGLDQRVPDNGVEPSRELVERERAVEHLAHSALQLELISRRQEVHVSSPSQGWALWVGPRCARR